MAHMSTRGDGGDLVLFKWGKLSEATLSPWCTTPEMEYSLKSWSADQHLYSYKPNVTFDILSTSCYILQSDLFAYCSTNFQHFMLKAKGKNLLFSQQLDIHCSANKEYEGRLSELDIFCPSDNSDPPIITKPRTQTALSTKPALIGMLLNLPKIGDPSENVVTEKIFTSSPVTAKLPTSKTVNIPVVLAVSNKSNAFNATGSVSISTGVIVALGVVLVIIGGAVCLCKQSNRHSLRKMWMSPRRDRYSSRQPFLEEIKVDRCDGRLPEPFSGSDDEDITFTRSPTQARGNLKPFDTYHAVDEETFYTPRTTPRPTPKLAKHNPRDVAEETSTWSVVSLKS